MSDDDLHRTLRSVRQELAIRTRELEQMREREALLQERTQFAEEQATKAQASREKLEIITTLTRELASFDLDGVLEVCVQRIPYLVQARFASVYVHDAEARRLLLKQHTHGREIDGTVDLEAKAHTLMALAVRERRPLCIGDLPRFVEAEGLASHRPHQNHYTTSSCMIVPLIAGDAVHGVLNLADRLDGTPFDPEEHFGLVRQACELVAVSIRNARLFEEVERAARSDALTGVLNRPTWQETLLLETKRARRYGHPLGIAVVRVDGLGWVNNNHGYRAGDVLLQRVAQLLRGNVRDVDPTGRVDGRVFGVILPEQRLPGALVVARRLAKLLGETSVEIEGSAHAVDPQVGVALFNPEDPERDLLGVALDALDADPLEPRIHVAE